jgi:hypothetical protein
VSPDAVQLIRKSTGLGVGLKLTIEPILVPGGAAVPLLNQKRLSGTLNLMYADAVL